MENLVDHSLAIAFQFGVHVGSLLASLVDFVRNFRERSQTTDRSLDSMVH
jgi:hypothetical protein